MFFVKQFLLNLFFIVSKKIKQTVAWYIFCKGKSMEKIMKKNMLIIFSSLGIILSSFTAQADCIQSYAEALIPLKAQRNKNTAASVTLTVMTIIFPPAGIAKLGAYSAKGFLTYDGTKRYISFSDLADMQQIIEEAYVEEGEKLRFVTEVVNEENPHVTVKDIAQSIVTNNEANLYCRDNNLSITKDLFLSLGVSEQLAEKKSKFFSRLQAEKFATPATEVSPIIGH